MDYQQTVLSAIDYIENNMFEENVYHHLFDHIFLSKYHFHRIFYTMTNETIADYIRKRKFTIIAKKLKFTNEKIIDIAFACGYNSHKSFTRAFKKYFSISPSEFRKNPNENKLLVMDCIDERKLSNIYFQSNYVPYFESIDQLNLTGIRGTVDLMTMNVQSYWSQLLEYFSENCIQLNGDYLYMIWESVGCDPRKIDFSEQQNVFIGGVFYDAKRKMDQSLISNQVYACFRLTQTFEYLHDLYSYIYFSWFKKSDMILDDNYIIERYSKDFSFEQKTGFMEILVPIKKQQMSRK